MDTIFKIFVAVGVVLGLVIAISAAASAIYFAAKLVFTIYDFWNNIFPL